MWTRKTQLSGHGGVTLEAEASTSLDCIEALTQNIKTSQNQPKPATQTINK